MAATLFGLLWGIGAATALDNWFYDRCLSSAPKLKEASNAVLIVSASPEILSSENNRKELIGRLDQLGATGIAFTMPFQQSEVDRNGHEASAWIITPDRYCDPRSRQEFSHLGRPENGDEVIFAGFAPSSDGLLRSQRMTFADLDQSGPSLEAAVAERWFQGRWNAPDETFLICYSEHEAGIPVVPADVVIADGLVPELVRERIVLIGLERHPAFFGLTGPIRSDVPMTPLEAHGHALNSLLTQSWISNPPRPVAIGVIVLGSLLVYGLSLRCQKQRRGLVCGLLATELIAGCILLISARVWFPVGLLWGAQLSAALTCSAYSRWRISNLIGRAALKIRNRIRLRQQAFTTGGGSVAERFERQRRSAKGTAEDSFAEVYDGLDWLQFELDLLERVFLDSETGFALYDSSGTAIRENRSWSRLLSIGIDESSPTSLSDLRYAVKAVQQENTPVSLPVFLQDRFTESQIHLRPLEQRWSSPLAAVDSADLLRIRFVICEWVLSEVASPAEPNPALSQQTVVQDAEDFFESLVKLNNDAPTNASVAETHCNLPPTETVGNFKPRQIPSPLQREESEESSPEPEEAAESVHE